MTEKLIIELDSESVELARERIIDLHVLVNNLMATIGKSRLLRWIFGIDKAPDYMIDPADWGFVTGSEKEGEEDFVCPTCKSIFHYYDGSGAQCCFCKPIPQGTAK